MPPRASRPARAAAHVLASLLALGGGRAGAEARLPPTDVPVVGSWIHVEVRFGGLTSSTLSDHVLFFANGVAVRSGFTPSTHDCYAALDVANVRDLPFNSGRWRDDPTTGGVRVDWKEGPAWSLKREGGLLSLGGKKLLVLRHLDGLRLDGTFLSGQPGGPSPKLAFRPDGTFTASGLTEGMTCRPPTGPPPDSASGRYSVRKWTLILELAGGGVVLFPITVPDGEDLKRVARFSLGAYDFERAGG